MTVICTGAVATCAAASVILAVKLNVPITVGVPDNRPTEERVNPPGNSPALTLQVKGAVPPVAASVVEYAVPNPAEGSVDGVVISRGCGLELDPPGLVPPQLIKIAVRAAQERRSTARFGECRGPREIAIVFSKLDSEHTDGRKTPTQGCMQHFSRMD